MKKKKLSPKQELFCKLYASDREFFGNGAQSYIKAFSSDKKTVTYNSAKAAAYTLLVNPLILDRIDKLFETRGLNNAYVDKQLEKLLTQDADFRAKIQAIKEYNALKSRITEKHELVNPINITVTRSDGAIRGNEGGEND